LGGDYYGIKEVKDDVIALYIWDFSGHGITAAINTFRLHSILQNMHEYRHDPAALLLMMNERLYKLLSVEQYATMFYAVFDMKAQRLSYVGAGSVSPFLISFKDRKVKKVNASGFPLGIIDSPDYQNTIIDFKDWDTIFLYSDALIETEDKHKNVFDVHQFITNLIESQNGFPTENRSAWLLDKVLQEFNSKYAQNISDDLTITVISK
jgi:sigma-B regulation protein RsbU (phosphoserine phosphatase)